MPADPREATSARTPGGRVIDFSMTLCQFILIALMLLVSISVACRLVGIAFEISEELAGYLLVAFTFLSLAGCAVHGAFHRVELLTAHLRPRPLQILELAFVLLSLAATLTLDWYLILFVIQSYQSGNVAPTTLATPLWIPEILMPLGITLLAFGLLIILWWDLRRRSAVAQDARG